MKHFLSVSGLMLMLLSGCAALPENENGAASDVQAASEVVAPQAASDVAAPSVQAASESVAPPKWIEMADDVKVLSAATQNPTETAKEHKKNNISQNNKNDKTEKVTATPNKLNVTLRNQPKITDNKMGSKHAKNTQNNKNVTTVKGKTVKVPVVTLPPPKPAKPVLTRRQILEQEIARERAALKSAQTQLAAAKKSGNAKQITKLNAAVRDRELNVRAIEAEMRR